MKIIRFDVIILYFGAINFIIIFFFFFFFFEIQEIVFIDSWRFRSLILSEKYLNYLILRLSLTYSIINFFCSTWEGMDDAAKADQMTQDQNLFFGQLAYVSFVLQKKPKNDQMLLNTGFFYSLVSLHPILCFIKSFNACFALQSVHFQHDLSTHISANYWGIHW